MRICELTMVYIVNNFPSAEAGMWSPYPTVNQV